jgi:hypothetical protein
VLCAPEATGPSSPVWATSRARNDQSTTRFSDVWARIGHRPKRPLPATLCADSVLGLERCRDAWASRLPNLDVELELCPRLWRSPLSPELDTDRAVVAFHGGKPHPLEEANEVVYQRRMADSNSHGRNGMLPRLTLGLKRPRRDWPEVQT